MSALHAKVISVDKSCSLITSANLSRHGQQGNIELSALIESKAIAKQVDEQRTSATAGDVFIDEFIPYVEETYGGISETWARILLGGSNGGGESMSLQYSTRRCSAAHGSCARTEWTLMPTRL